MLAGVRTAIGLTIPDVDAEALAHDLDELKMYSSDEILADPERLFSCPGSPPRLTLGRHRRIFDGSFMDMHWRSPYEPLNPRFVREFESYKKLRTVHVAAWRHKRPAAASILLTHGWGAGHQQVHHFEFGIDYLYRHLGLDVYFYVAPYHGKRRPSQSIVSGALHPSPNLMRTNEGFIQTVKELRGTLSAILDYNDAPIGMMGSSLGGYTSALTASIDYRLSFVIPIMAPGSLAELFWHQMGVKLAHKLEGIGMTLESFKRAWALHSPLSYRPKVPFEDRFVVTAGGDALVPARMSKVLWEHWGRPRTFEFTGSHLVQFGRIQYHHEVGRFLHERGFV
ncbi:MAG: hypothetical protein AUK47_13780 [Deltaproteobacteria bacterium CG2_30_63_29]|nr:MAG: hypothetical protein AUK47_13780 [Deltaproteobacteria bacterium CG2_30_63_29]PIW00986.1 MAG: hypothetical protein COW42_06255 [Deltaproteobacteria bacterium CG17_big_fil_post_rev_8_21_14_2_50_63_7]PJB48346.1 MAG: hypothetical protein CO108_02525 [Deltaproteobacteria bacterium CG_4_9_14_3_um_filter_63_12]